MYLLAPISGEIWRLVLSDPSCQSVNHLYSKNGDLRNLARTSLDMIGRMLAFTNKVST